MGERLLSWAEAGDSAKLASWLAGGPPEYWMFSNEGNALVDDWVCKARNIPFKQQWSYIQLKLKRVQAAGHGECFDSSVRDKIWVRDRSDMQPVDMPLSPCSMLTGCPGPLRCSLTRSHAQRSTKHGADMPQTALG